MADEKDTKQTTAGGEAEKAKPTRAPRKAAAKKPAGEAAGKKTAAAGKKTVAADESPAIEQGTEAKKPARSRAKAKAGATAAPTEAAQAETPSAEAETAEPATEVKPAPAKAGRARKAPAKAEPAAEGAAEGAPAKPARRRAAAKPAAAAEPRAARKAKPVREAVHRAPDERVAQVVGADGKQVDEIKLSAERFGLAPDVNLLHLAVRAEQAARRRGTASTRTRGEISGSTAKLYRQKGTGRARAGSVKSPTRSGGGTAFGPKPRDFGIKINRKAARKALAMALSDRAEGGTIYVARGLELKAPSTAAVNELLVTLDIPAPVLIVTDDEPVIALSVRNLAYAEYGEACALSVEQVLRNRSVVVTEKALPVLTGAPS